MDSQDVPKKRPFSGTISDDSTNACRKQLCPVCGKSLSSKCNLIRHVNRFHSQNSDVVKEINKKRSFKFLCNICPRKFNKLRDFNYHKRHDHNLESENNLVYRCPLCKESFFKKLIINHFESCHDIKIETEELKFNNYESFLSWKNEMEAKTKSKFIHYSCGRGSSYYKCHRSGNFESKSTGKRHLKRTGSNKIDAYCPASIKVKLASNGECTVHFRNKHVGHENDLGHLFLTQDERKSLAAKIAAKIPFDCILDDVRASASDSGLQRMDLLTRKDLHNIGKSFNLTSEASTLDNDYTSVELWAREMQNSENPCVLFYKSQDITSDYRFIKSDDFILVIMTEAQTEILSKFGSEFICVDSTREVNVLGFQLITILVLDDMHQGFPCAFMISNRCDQPLLTFFFSLIKQKVGVLKPRIFMYDMNEAFFNAWTEQMGIPERKLFCAWHVDRDWRKKLKLIKESQKRADTYKIFHSLLLERDENTFNIMMETAINHLKQDYVTYEFARYFEMHYTKNKLSWANFCRHNSGLNINNMRIERMHRTIKYIYLHGKYSKRLDKAIHAIMRFVKDRLMDRLIVFSKAKIASKLRNLNKLHKRCLEIKYEICEINGSFIITPFKSKQSYKIDKMKDKCDCPLICNECNTCIHKYICTCFESSIKWNMCQHIHYFCLHLQKGIPIPLQSPQVQASLTTRATLNFYSQANATLSPSSNDSLDNSDSDSLIDVPGQNIISCDNKFESVVQDLGQCITVQSQTLNERREMIIKNYVDFIKTLSSPEQCDLMDKNLETIAATIDAMKSTV